MPKFRSAVMKFRLAVMKFDPAVAPKDENQVARRLEVVHYVRTKTVSNHLHAPPRELETSTCAFQIGSDAPDLQMCRIETEFR